VGSLVIKIDGNLVINFIFDVKVIFSLDWRPRNYALISLCRRWLREPPPKIGTGCCSAASLSRHQCTARCWIIQLPLLCRGRGTMHRRHSTGCTVAAHRRRRAGLDDVVPGAPPRMVRASRCRGVRVHHGEAWGRCTRSGMGNGCWRRSDPGTGNGREKWNVFSLLLI
jgi:hypothetical protein